MVDGSVPSWWRGVACGLLFGACGPSLSDRPDDFKGDGHVSVGTICGDTTVGGTQSAAAWIKTAVRSRAGVNVDWSGVTVYVDGVSVVRRAAGRVSDIEDGQKQRIVTYWAVAKGGKPGDEAMLGPLVVRYKVDGQLRSYEAPGCPLIVE